MRKDKYERGAKEVPQGVYYGEGSLCSYGIFETNLLPMPRAVIHALTLIKKYAARVNARHGLIKKEIAAAIETASDELLSGSFTSDILPGVFQTGSGTATNMNVNEILSNRATELLFEKSGEECIVHPNDDVNCSQSSNDTIPSAIRIACSELLFGKLLPVLQDLSVSFEMKSSEFSTIVKCGRTHLNDALPIMLGDEFKTFALLLKRSIRSLEGVIGDICILPLGGTAVGTGVNAPESFGSDVALLLSNDCLCDYTASAFPMAQMSAQGELVDLSGRLRELSVTLMKISNDLRWMSSGPRCSLHEIELPQLQAGSSIMPGKVNPVVCEAVMMIAQKVCGNDACIAGAGKFGNFQLHTMLPLIGYSLIESIEILIVSVSRFRTQCVDGITAQTEQCEEYANNTLMIAAALNKFIGYDKGAKIVSLAEEQGRSIIDVAIENLPIEEETLRAVLDPRRLAGR